MSRSDVCNLHFISIRGRRCGPFTSLFFPLALIWTYRRELSKAGKGDDHIIDGRSLALPHFGASLGYLCLNLHELRKNKHNFLSCLKHHFSLFTMSKYRSEQIKSQLFKLISVHKEYNKTKQKMGLPMN